MNRIALGAVLSYVGIDMIVDSNTKISELEEKKKPYLGVGYRSSSKTFMVGLRIGL